MSDDKLTDVKLSALQEYRARQLTADNDALFIASARREIIHLRDEVARLKAREDDASDQIRQYVEALPVRRLRDWYDAGTKGKTLSEAEAGILWSAIQLLNAPPNEQPATGSDAT